jgi:hypothetical protein
MVLKLVRGWRWLAGAVRDGLWPAFGRVCGEMKVSFGKAVSSHRTP